MNKVILLGRLTKNPEITYTSGENPIAVARYTLAVNRKYKRQGEPEADFINCVAFGKSGEFAEKYLKKGQMIGIVGRLQIRQWEDQNGNKRWSTDVIVEENYFTGSKRDDDRTPQVETGQTKSEATSGEGFYPADDIDDSDLPF